MPLGMTGNTFTSPNLADTQLHVIGIGRYEANPSGTTRPHRIDTGQRRRRGRLSSAHTDCFAKAPVALGSKPAGRSAVPGHGIDLGVGKQIRRRQHPGWIKLIHRLGIQRDLGHPEAGEVRADPGGSSQHGAGHRFENRIRRRREHPKARSHCIHHRSMSWLTLAISAMPCSRRLPGKSRAGRFGAIASMARPFERRASIPRG
jgi:hypothetical protein